MTKATTLNAKGHSRQTRRAFPAALMAGGALLFGMLGAARAADPALIEAAKKEGELVLYTGLIVNQIVRPMTEAFQKKYGINVTYLSISSQAEIALKVTNEHRAGKVMADVVEGGGQMIPALLKAGALEAYRPASAQHYAPEFSSPEGFWHIVSVNYLMAAYNTDLVKAAEAPRSFEDLLDPKWKGKMVWSGDPNSAGAPGFVGNVLMSLGEPAGRALLGKLKEQKPVALMATQRVVLDQVISGQYPLALTTFFHHAVISRAQGAPVQWLPLEPVITVGNIVGLVKNRPHPNAGKLFLDFVLSEEGQNLFRAAGYIPTHPAVASTLPPVNPGGAPFRKLVITPEMSAENLPGWTKTYSEIFE